MTIDELLKAAQEYTRLAIIEGANFGSSHEIRALFAQLAQAAAQTAQAMIWRDLTSWTDGLPGAVLPVTRFDV